MRNLLCLTLLFMLLLVALPALAQDATIVGTVTDSSGAAVPNVTVTITNTDTGQVRQLATNEVGQYTAPGLHIGHYAVRAQGTGFKVVERKDIVLNVGDRTRVDVQLQIGQTQESITVEATGISVQSDTGEVSELISGKQVSQLATNGRSIYTLVNLSPGTSSLQDDFQIPTPVGGNANVSFNGNRPGHNIYLLDGGENLDRGGAGTFSVQPSIDSIAEFRALTSNYSAEYGLSSAGTITTVLKSGTKQYHASAWEFNRNDAMQARNYFQDKKPKLRFNTFGFNGGGPVDFWKSDHKTFFFYNMEWRKLIQGNSVNQNVPIVATYGGNFAGNLPADLKLSDKTTVVPNSGFHVPCAYQLSAAQITRFNGAGITTFSTPGADGTCSVNGDASLANNPQFVAWPANAIPAALLDSNAKALLAAGIFPAPNSGTAFKGGADQPTNVREEIVRMDHQFNDKFSIFGHFIAEQITQTFGTTMWSGDNVPTVGNTFGNPSYSAVVHATHMISPALLNEVAFNYNGNRINIIPFGALASSNFKFNRIFGGPNEGDRLPIINLSSPTGAQYSANWTPWKNVADSYQLRDDLSWTKGAHQLKFGFSWQTYRKVQDVFGVTQGNFEFNGKYSGNDFADFLLGYGKEYQEDAIHDNGHWNANSYAAYIQDNWRVNNRLTLNLGLRWDGVPHTYEANHRTSAFFPALYDPTKVATFDNNGNICGAVGNGCTGPSPGLGTSPNSILAGYQFYLNGIGIDGLGGIPKGLVDNHWAAFGPRIGFAYDLTGSGKTVVRGGFGMMYERVQGNDMYDAGNNVPFSAHADFNQGVLLSNPKTSIQDNSTLTVPIVVASVTNPNRTKYNLPVSYQFSAGVQRELWSHSVLSVSYVGNQNRYQSDRLETNLPAQSALAGIIAGTTKYDTVVPYKGFHSILMENNEANGHYNSLQVSLRAQTRRDLTLQFAYTLSRSIDAAGNNDRGYDLTNVSNPYAGWQYDVGPSFFDRTHVAFVNFVWDIPVFRNASSRALKTTLGGWQLSGIISMQTGAPLDITYGKSDSISNIIPNSKNRPNWNGSIDYPKTAAQWFSAASLSDPAKGQWGNLPHNEIRGPGRHNWNLSLFKNFVLSESRGSRFEIRAETFNFWNHTQFRGDKQGGGIGTTLGQSDFGQVKAAFDPRTLQLGAKLIF